MAKKKKIIVVKELMFHEKKLGKITSAVFTDKDHSHVSLKMDGESWTVSKASGDRLWDELEKQNVKISDYVAPEMSKDEFCVYCKKEIDRIRLNEISMDVWDDLTDSQKSKWKKHIKTLRDLHNSVNLKGIATGDTVAAKSKMPKPPKS